MTELLYQAHDLLGDKAVLNVLLVALLWKLRRAPAVFAALCFYLANIGRKVGVPDADTGVFVKFVRAHTQPHAIVETSE